MSDNISYLLLPISLHLSHSLSDSKQAIELQADRQLCALLDARRVN